MDPKKNSKKYSDVVNKYLLKMISFSTEENFHLLLMRLYTKDSFIYKNMNFYLRENKVDSLEHLFPFYFLLQHSFFLTYKNED